MLGPGVCLWIEGDIEEAARFYTGLIPNSEVGVVQHPAPGMPAISLKFSLNGRHFSLLANAQPGPRVIGMSIEIITEDQAETDRLWQAHLDAGGSALACGWLTDRFSIAWQIIPQQMPGLLFGGTPRRKHPRLCCDGKHDQDRHSGAGTRQSRRLTMAYIDGFAAAVPAANREAYIAYARKSWVLFQKAGALRMVEGWGDDVPDGVQTSFPMAVKQAEGEVVLFSWIEWPDKATRNACHATMMENPDWQTLGEMPFDGKRMIFGGFVPVVDLS